MGAHLSLAHGHDVDGFAELVDREGFVGAEFFASVFADEDNGEVGGRNVEAEAGGLSAFDCERCRGRGGAFIGDGDDDDVALGDGGGVFAEAAELDLELGVSGVGSEDEQWARGVAECGQ